MLNDDCLGRTLDWLYAHDLTQLFAGIASRARRVFGVKAQQMHVDTTSFAVSGEYSRAAAEASGSQDTVIAITCKRQEQSEPRAIGKTEPPPF